MIWCLFQQLCLFNYVSFSVIAAPFLNHDSTKHDSKYVYHSICLFCSASASVTEVLSFSLLIFLIITFNNAMM